mmetsp:Transcript_156746/g.500204  ORF Transcript_156746/g.500204 Transcript_156746/m.500204 type:complete len:227 (-) Transcript_156746:360-1040(-)
MRSLRASEQRPTPSRKERRRASVSCFKWSWVTASANNGATEANTFSLTMSTNCGRASPKSWRMSLRELAKVESAPNSVASHTAIRRESPMLLSLILFKKGSQSTVWQDTAERPAAPPSNSFNSRRAAARSDSNRRTTARNSETTMASSDRGTLHKDGVVWRGVRPRSPRRKASPSPHALVGVVHLGRCCAMLAGVLTTPRLAVLLEHRLRDDALLVGRQRSCTGRV